LRKLQATLQYVTAGLRQMYKANSLILMWIMAYLSRYM